MSTYAILGITGHVGGVAARQLLAAGAGVRAVMRSNDKAQSWRDRGVQVAIANLHDRAALQAAFEGVAGVFVMTPTWFEAEDMFAENAKAIDSVGYALRAGPAQKVVLLSSIGAHRDHGTGAIKKLHDMEVALSDLPAVTSVRAGWFMENFAGLVGTVRETGVLPSMLAPLDRAIPMIATADIGVTVADLLRSDWTGQRVIDLEGPARYSPNDVAAAFAAVLKRDVHAQLLPPSQWRAAYRSWGLTPRSAEAMAEMLDAFNSGWIAYGRDWTDTTHGVTSLNAVLENALDAV